MKQITLVVRASLDAALSTGIPLTGTEEYPVSHEDLANLPEGLRDEFKKWAVTEGSPEKNRVLSLIRPELTWETIVASLEAARDHAETAEARKWAWEQNLDKWFWRWVDDDENEEWDIDPRAMMLSAKYPTVAARLPEIRAELEKRNAVVRSLPERRARASAGLRTYALSIPQLSRAAAEGYEVENEALNHFADALRGGDEDAFVLVEGTPEFERSKWDKRKAPNAAAFVRRDAVQALIERTPAPEGVEVRLEPIARFRRAEDVGVTEDHWVLSVPFTAIVVSIECPIAKRRIVVSIAE